MIARRDAARELRRFVLQLPTSTACIGLANLPLARCDSSAAFRRSIMEAGPAPGDRDYGSTFRRPSAPVGPSFLFLLPLPVPVALGEGRGEGAFKLVPTPDTFTHARTLHPHLRQNQRPEMRNSEGKLHVKYLTEINTLQVACGDMERIGLSKGDSLRLASESGRQTE